MASFLSKFAESGDFIDASIALDEEALRCIKAQLFRRDTWTLIELFTKDSRDIPDAHQDAGGKCFDTQIRVQVLKDIDL